MRGQLPVAIIALDGLLGKQCHDLPMANHDPLLMEGMSLVLLKS